MRENQGGLFDKFDDKPQQWMSFDEPLEDICEYYDLVTGNKEYSDDLSNGVCDYYEDCKVCVSEMHKNGIHLQEIRTKDRGNGFMMEGGE